MADVENAYVRPTTDSPDDQVTISDVLSGRARMAPLMQITPGQRLYYNYRLDPPSFEREIAGRIRAEARDFRSERERKHDPTVSD